MSNLAVVLADAGQISEFIRHFEGALKVHPKAMTAQSNLLLTLHWVDVNRPRSECLLGSGSETPGAATATPARATRRASGLAAVG